jgi:DUF2075 family protein
LKVQDKIDYEINPADVIDEEDYEDSMGEMSSLKKKKAKSTGLKDKI